MIIFEVFKIIYSKYENGNIVLMNNKYLGNRDKLMNDIVITTAILDRLFIMHIS
ncbi:ATP-binding protein [Acetivibrio mesophilus]|uniref:IstB-like ATP-binding domain-containing protein n=1 Tax=Acetivibrio mesophilus TaxID=2487273 RepID=A0A4V1K2E7_9FIRM|nr:hypothetical protein EFD62_04545 [Acetivibrio mesophilus]HHV30033.1 ATP-binding protein [Clostridium sp.]